MYVDLVFFNDLNVLQEFSRKFNQNFIICKTFTLAELKKLKEEIKTAKLPFLICHLLSKTDNKELKAFSQKADFIAVNGSSLKAKEFAVSNKKVSFLLHATSAGKPEFDTALCTLARQNNVFIAILFSDFLNQKNFNNSLLLKNYLFALKLCKKKKVPVAFFSGASKPEELRQVKDLASFAVMLGYFREEALKIVRSTEKNLLERSKNKEIEISEIVEGE